MGKPCHFGQNSWENEGLLDDTNMPKKGNLLGKNDILVVLFSDLKNGAISLPVA